MRDAVDEMVRLLRSIEQQVGDSTTVNKETTTDIDQEIDEGGIIDSTPALDPRSTLVRESSDLDAANDDGSITVEPGEYTTLVDAEATTGVLGILAVGAQDEENVRYGIRIDDKTFFAGMTESPLGTVVNPFSFLEKMNAYVPAEKRVEYVAYRDADVTSSVNLTARMYATIQA